MPVKYLVQQVVWREAFLSNAQKLFCKVRFNIQVPWGIVPCDVSFSVLCLSCCLLFFSGLNVSL